MTRRELHKQEGHLVLFRHCILHQIRESLICLLSCFCFWLSMSTVFSENSSLIGWVMADCRKTSAAIIMGFDGLQYTQLAVAMLSCPVVKAVMSAPLSMKKNLCLTVILEIPPPFFPEVVLSALASWRPSPLKSSEDISDSLISKDMIAKWLCEGSRHPFFFDACTLHCYVLLAKGHLSQLPSVILMQEKSCQCFSAAFVWMQSSGINQMYSSLLAQSFAFLLGQDWSVADPFLILEHRSSQWAAERRETSFLIHTSFLWAEICLWIRLGLRF